MLNKYRFFNITMCENVVQFATQVIYLYNENGRTKYR